MDPEFLKALELVAEYERQRPVVVKENRLYYNDDGTIVGLWETEHPQEGEYIVLTDTGMFHRYPTQLLRVIDGKLKYLEPKKHDSVRLIKSTTGQRVVAGHAALPLMTDELYSNIEYYDRNN
jgi:hypothetical protein